MDLEVGSVMLIDVLGCYLDFTWARLKNRVGQKMARGV